MRARSIPDRAAAALDLRLVKETPAADLLARLRAHVEKQGYHLVDSDPDDAVRAKYSRIARIELDTPPTNAFRTASSDPQAHAVAAALARTFGQPPVQLRTLGGTVPIAPFIEALGFPALVVPTVNFDNNQHEENENLPGSRRSSTASLQWPRYCGYDGGLKLRHGRVLRRRSKGADAHVMPNISSAVTSPAARTCRRSHRQCGGRSVS